MMRTCLTSRVVWCLAALVLVLGVALTAPAQQTPAPIQIAWAGPLTGDAAQFGQGYLKGIQLAFEEWNAKGGVLGGRKFVVVTEDDACDPKQAGTVATKIADDAKNVVFIGHVCSGTTIAGAPIINKVNLPMVTLSSNPTITQQGFKNLFRPIANDNVQGKAGVAYAMRKLKAKKFALLNDKQAFGQGVTDVAKATIEKAGGSITSSGGVERNDVDYTAVLTKIVKTENPDALVYCSNFPTSIGLMVKQARQLGYKKPIIGCDGWFDIGMVKTAGAAGRQEVGQRGRLLHLPGPAPHRPSGSAEGQGVRREVQGEVRGRSGELRQLRLRLRQHRGQRDPEGGQHRQGQDHRRHAQVVGPRSPDPRVQVRRQRRRHQRAAVHLHGREGRDQARRAVEGVIGRRSGGPRAA